jgi:hypothetical protein
MIWFFERESDLVICEIRHSTEGQTYEFEMAPSEGPTETRSYTSAGELIEQYLRTQMTLKAQGWRPKISDLEMLG